MSALLLEPDGKLLMGGTFTNVNNVPRTSIARLLPDGSVDDAFVPPNFGPSGLSGSPTSVSAIARQSDGKILLAGRLRKTTEGRTLNGLARLYPDGALDEGFQPGPGPDLNGIQLYPNGQILVYGNFSSYNGASFPGLARLQPNGSLDTNFAIKLSPSSVPSSALLQDDQSVVISRIKLFRYFDNGSQDKLFGESDVNVQKLYSASGNRILGARPGIYRRLADGRPDLTLTDSFRWQSSVSDAAEQSDHKLLLAGIFPAFSALKPYVIRLLSDGSFDSAFRVELLGDPFHEASAVVLQPDGKILVGGPFAAPDSTNSLAVMRLNGGVSLVLRA